MARTMTVLLQKPSGDDPTEFDVDPQVSIADFERAILESDPSLQNGLVSLVFGEVILKDDATRKSLRDYGVADGCTVTLLRCVMPETLTASSDKTAKIWSTATGECTQTFSGHGGVVGSALFSSDGSSGLTASYDKTAHGRSCVCHPGL